MNATKTEKKSLNVRELASRRTDVLHISPRELTIKEGLNIRGKFGDDQEDLDFLENIRENGVKEPILIYREGTDLIVSNGHRRLTAVLMCISEGADIKTVPCIVAEQNYREENAVIDAFIRNTGRPLTPYEQSIGVQRLFNYGWTAEQIAKKIGKTQAHVSNLKTLANLPHAVQNSIEEGKISSSLALQISRECDKPEEIEKVVEATVKNAKKEGKTHATKKNKPKNKTAEEESVRIGRLKLVNFIEDMILGLEEEKHRENAMEKAKEWLEMYND